MRSSSIYSFFVACICTAALAYSCAYIVPKELEASAIEIEPLFPVSPHLVAAAKMELVGFAVIAVGFFVGVAGLLVSLIAPLWRRFGGISVPICGMVLSLGFLLLLCWHGFALWKVSSEARGELYIETKSYRRALEEFTILEEVEGRMANAKERLRQIVNYEPRAITDVSEMSRFDARRRLNKLVRLLQQEKDPAKARKIIATCQMFSDFFPQDRERLAIVLESASKIANQEFTAFSKLQDWIKLQPSEDWEPMTIYDVTPPRKSDGVAPRP